VDRVKNLFKLEHGGFIAPEKLENLYVKSPKIDQIWITGISTKSYVLAFIFPNAQACGKDLDND
jgi:long-chain acyl-CoA synthetase